MINRDVIARCVVADGSARVVVVILTELAREAARRHGAGGASALAMGRVGAAGLLLATLTKGDERVNLQVLGDGPLGAVTVDASANGNARVFVGNPRVVHFATHGRRPHLGDAIGKVGVVNVLRDLGLRDTFRGQTPLVDGEVDTDVEGYLLGSEQIDSTIGCEVFPDTMGGIRFAAGILIQALPGGLGTELVAAARQRIRAGTLTAALYARLDDGTDVPITTSDVASDALGDDAGSLLQLGEPRAVQFHCPCSRERAAATLAMLGEDELMNMIEEDGRGQVTCEFCRRQYNFTDQNLEEIRHRIRRDSVQPS